MKKSLEDGIREVLFKVGKELVLHKLDNDNFIVEIDYEKYVSELKSILGEYNSTPRTLE
jgi:predicted hydrocarbon binding protein